MTLLFLCLHQSCQHRTPLSYLTTNPDRNCANRTCPANHRPAPTPPVVLRNGTVILHHPMEVPSFDPDDPYVYPQAAYVLDLSKVGNYLGEDIVVLGRDFGADDLCVLALQGAGGGRTWSVTLGPHDIDARISCEEFDRMDSTPRAEDAVFAYRDRRGLGKSGVRLVPLKKNFFHMK